jgi:hypothetical protein
MQMHIIKNVNLLALEKNDNSSVNSKPIVVTFCYNNYIATHLISPHTRMNNCNQFLLISLQLLIKLKLVVALRLVGTCSMCVYFPIIYYKTMYIIINWPRGN